MDKTNSASNYGDNGPYNTIPEQNNDYGGGRGEHSRQDNSSTSKNRKRRKTDFPNVDQIDWESGQGHRKRKIPDVYKQNFVKAQEEEDTQEILRPKARIKPKLLEARGLEEWDPRAKDLMLKTGYVPGKGLGSKATGIENPVDAGRENDGRGLGFQRKFEQENTDWKFEEEQTVEKEVKWILKDNSLDIHTIISGMAEGEKKEDIADELNFCKESVLREILRLKTLLDDMKPRELLEARTRSNPYEKIKKGIFINRAAMKMANIDSILDFEFTKFDNSAINDDLLYFADVCAGPGGFTEYVLYRKKWLAKGFDFTLKGDCDFKLRTFKVASTETFEAIYGPYENSDGDVYNPENVQYFVTHVQKNTGGLGVHFMMADGGFSVERKENIQEILSHQIYLSQCLIALSIVRTGGHFVCKFFDIFTPFSVGLIYLFNLCFERVAVHKPVTSRPANSERYLYCMNKLNSRNVGLILVYLKKCHTRMWELKSIEGKETTVTDLVDLEILKNKTCNFFHYIYESNTEFGKDQIEGLKKIIAYHKNQDLKETRQMETRTKFMNAWRIEMVHIDVGDLLAENIIDSLIKSPDTLLTAGNLKPAVKSPYFWVCTPIECPESRFHRTFYKSNGRSSISKYEGGYRNKWSSLGDNFVTFEMPKNTLVYGEIVFGKQNRAAFYIIDGYMLGGINIQNENFDTRIKMCEKFALAVNKERNDRGNSLASVKVKSFTKLGKEYFPEFISKLKYLQDPKSQDVYCPLDLESESPLYQTSSLLFLKITKEPWIKHWSRSQNREYYYHTLSKQSFYDVPIDADADFSYTVGNRLVWYWNRRLLNDTSTNPSQQLTYHSLLQYLKSL